MEDASVDDPYDDIRRQDSSENAPYRERKVKGWTVPRHDLDAVGIRLSLNLKL
jgi:hypothetical protein